MSRLVLLLALAFAGLTRSTASSTLAPKSQPNESRSELEFITSPPTFRLANTSSFRLDNEQRTCAFTARLSKLLAQIKQFFLNVWDALIRTGRVYPKPNSEAFMKRWNEDPKLQRTLLNGGMPSTWVEYDDELRLFIMQRPSLEAWKKNRKASALLEALTVFDESLGIPGAGHLYGKQWSEHWKKQMEELSFWRRTKVKARVRRANNVLKYPFDYLKKMQITPFLYRLALDSDRKLKKVLQSNSLSAWKQNEKTKRFLDYELYWIQQHWTPTEFKLNRH